MHSSVFIVSKEVKRLQKSETFVKKSDSGRPRLVAVV